jgi:hypothetical protein
MQWRFARDAPHSPELGVSRFTHPTEQRPARWCFARKSAALGPAPLPPRPVESASSAHGGRPRKARIAALNSSGRSKLLMWPAPGMTTRRARGIARSNSRATL